MSDESQIVEHKGQRMATSRSQRRQSITFARPARAAMLGKLLLIVVSVGAIAAALLVNRQQRIDTAHDITRLHQRLIEQEQTLWQLRSEVAQQTRPELIRDMVEPLHNRWVAIPDVPLPSNDLRSRTRLAAGEAAEFVIEEDEYGG